MTEPPDNSSTVDKVAISDDVSGPLARAVGAFLRAVPRQELPGPLRRFQGFRPQALHRHRAELLAVLDDDAMRARVVAWLDDRPGGVGRAEAELLRVAAERGDGWRRRLRAYSEERTPRGPRADAGARLAERLAREQDRARRARDDARSAREEARREVTEERVRASSLAAERDDLRLRLRDAEAELAAARRDAARAVAGHERKLRAARRDLDRARAERDASRTELRAQRRRANSLEREVARLRRTLDRPAPVSDGAPAAPETDRRQPLPVPLGLLEDAPETLDAWLTTHDVHVLVDGYNVTRAPGGYGELDLAVQRDRLVEEVDRLARRKRARTTIVFDGSEVPPGTRRRRRAAVEVRYSAPEETADDHLVALLESLPPRPVVVVTNDRELRDRAAELGATAAGSGQLLSLIR